MSAIYRRIVALPIPALTVAKLYKKRWEIELFFKWIKGNLEIKHYYGTSANAVKTQISDILTSGRREPLSRNLNEPG